eukprot:scaffold267914_cov31-Tisochrysis_lutea.AAC.1
MTLVVWSKPLSSPTMTRPSLVITSITLSTNGSSIAAMLRPSRPAWATVRAGPAARQHTHTRTPHLARQTAAPRERRERKREREKRSELRGREVSERGREGARSERWRAMGGKEGKREESRRRRADRHPINNLSSYKIQILLSLFLTSHKAQGRVPSNMTLVLEYAPQARKILWLYNTYSRA